MHDNASAMRCLLALAFLCSACGGTTTSRPARAPARARPLAIVAILTVTVADEPTALSSEVHVRITRVLKAQRGVRVVDPVPRAGNPAESTDDAACVDDLDCLRRLGRGANAANIVTVRLAQLGRTLALRMSLVDARRGSEEASMQRIITSATEERVVRAVEAMARDIAERLSPTPPPPERTGTPWWTWPAVASGVAVVAGIGTFLIVDANNHDGGGGDDGVFVIDPP